MSDRYLDSSIAYQGDADALGAATIRALHEIGSEGLLPDRTLVLSLPIDRSIARADARDGGKADRFGARDAGYHARVAAAFRAMAEAEPDRFRLIDADGAADVVTGRLLAAIADLA